MKRLILLGLFVVGLFLGLTSTIYAATDPQPWPPPPSPSISGGG
ncbi:MAG: hypothetical protein AB1393_10570 [Candidatus Edwardsbacteria bacterium]